MANCARASKSGVRPKILWGNPTNKETIVSEKGWSASYTHYATVDGSIVMLKTGNKPYILSSNTGASGDDSKTIYPQASLLKKYRYCLKSLVIVIDQRKKCNLYKIFKKNNNFFYLRSLLYPVGDCFFSVHVVDGTKTYRPESQIIFDLPTAHAFFAANPQETLTLVGDAVRSLSKRWNDANATKVIDLLSPYFLKAYVLALCYESECQEKKKK